MIFFFSSSFWFLCSWASCFCLTLHTAASLYLALLLPPEINRRRVTALHFLRRHEQMKARCCCDCFNVKQIGRAPACLFTHSYLSSSNAARGSTQNTGELYIFGADLNGRRSRAARRRSGVPRGRSALEKKTTHPRCGMTTGTPLGTASRL